nr:hypothetical protein TetV2_00618 [Oceanusvirus sp.]
MLTLVRTLERNGGRLPPDFFGSSMDTFFGQCFKFGALKRSENGMKPDMPRATTSNPWILSTLRDPRVAASLSKHRVVRQEGDSNLLQAAANAYQTNFVNFFDYELPRRIKTLVKALWRESYPDKTPRPKGQLSKAVNYATILVDDVPQPVGVTPRFLQAVGDIRARHLAALEPPIIAAHRAAIDILSDPKKTTKKGSEEWNVISKQICELRRRIKYTKMNSRIEFVYWMLRWIESLDYADVEYKKFAMAPLSREQRVHITVDGNAFRSYFFPRLKSIGYYADSMNADVLRDKDILAGHMAAFLPGSENLRSRKQGWIPGSSFKTDGYSACRSFERESNITKKRGSGPRRVPESKKTKKEKREKKLEGTFDTMPENAIPVGCDMGVVYVYAVVWFGADGKQHKRLLSRYN